MLSHPETGGMRGLNFITVSPIAVQTKERSLWAIPGLRFKMLVLENLKVLVYDLKYERFNCQIYFP